MRYDDDVRNDDDEDYDHENNNDVEPCQIGNSRRKNLGVDTDQGIARHREVRHLKIEIKLPYHKGYISI